MIRYPRRSSSDLSARHNIISAVVRNPESEVVDAMAMVDEVVTSVIVAGELRTWVAKTNSLRLARLIETVLVAVPVQPLEANTAEIYARVRSSLERAGTTIGSNDLWIAAHALSIGATMVTDNEREFRRVDGLTVQNWLSR